jgi:hypothetical protein
VLSNAASADRLSIGKIKTQVPKRGVGAPDYDPFEWVEESKAGNSYMAPALGTIEVNELWLGSLFCRLGFAICLVFRSFRVAFANSQALQRLSDAVSIRKTAQDGGARDCRESSAKVGGQPSRGDVLAKLKVWIRREGLLKTAP